MKATITVIVTLCAIVIICSSCQDKRAWTSTDRWFNPPPDGVSGSQWCALPDSVFYLVDSSAVTSAESLLVEREAVELTAAKAATYSPRLRSVSKDEHLFLVRAVYLGDPERGFQLYASGDSLLVVHGSLGHDPLPMKHVPILTATKHELKFFFNRCYMAE
jgi:hypothetical protein